MSISIDMSDTIYSFWALVKNACTFGGEPYYQCANCHGGGHQYGVEGLRRHPKLCPDCGAIMLGDLDDIYLDFRQLELEEERRKDK